MSDYFKKPIFVMGLPRSGTSMVAGLLNICGAWTGSTVPCRSKINPKGFFEHSRIREQVIKLILKEIGCDPLGVTKLPPIDINIEANELLTDVLYQIIIQDGYKSDTPWLYKDPKLTLIWRIFTNAFPGAKWVIVRRDKDAVIDSCLRTHFMVQHSTDRDYWEKFTDEYLARIEAFKQADIPFFEIWSEEVITGNFEKVKELVEFLDLDYKESEVKEFVSPSYWNEGKIDA